MKHAPRVMLLLCTVFGSAAAQIPAENHYKTYATEAIENNAPSRLEDEFSIIEVTSMTMFRFAAPASVDGSVVYDEDAFQTWWWINALPDPREVTVFDRFGSGEWELLTPLFLAAPARRDPRPGEALPLRNNYLCYDAIGPVVATTVTVSDVFGREEVLVMTGKLVCMPVSRSGDGISYPVVDPDAHLACYIVDNPTPRLIPVTARDQFGDWQPTLIANDCLCSPADVERGSLDIEVSTWGRVKALYRD